MRVVLFVSLAFNLFWGAIASGWATAWVILIRPHRIRSGLVRMDYGPLGDTGAAFLAALITLTPGTTAVEIDTDRHELLLHLLDLDQAEATLAQIRCDLLEPLRRLTGGSR